ncbi:DUF3221 domain-containing protein [Paraclostridium tenue]
MKKQIIALLTVGLISVSGILVFANNKSSITKNDVNSNGGHEDISKVNGDVDVNDIAIRGIIKGIGIDKEVTSVRVEGNLEKDTSYDIADVLVGKDTIIKKGNSSSNLKVSDLKIGQKIEVVFQGPEGRSYPVTANAYSINIIDEKN